MAVWEVGDPLVLKSVNRRGGPWEGTVTKVGRLLVTIEAPGTGMSGEQFRMDTGRWNDKNFGHHYWIMTPAEHAERARVTEVEVTLRRTYGVDVSRSSLPLSALEAILSIVQGVDANAGH